MLSLPGQVPFVSATPFLKHCTAVPFGASAMGVQVIIPAHHVMCAFQGSAFPLWTGQRFIHLGLHSLEEEEARDTLVGGNQTV